MDKKLSKAERELLDSIVKHAAGRKRDAEKVAGGVKKKKGKKQPGGPKKRARDLVEEFGLCPISLQPMRRPVLPSSGQAYDEINIVRFCSGGRKRCPVSGVPLEFHRKGARKGSVTRTPDYALRNVIRHQAAAAKVYIAPIDKEHLLRELEAVTGLDEPSEDFATVMPSIAKAVVDDTYLGYIGLPELRGLLAGASPGNAGRAGCAGAVFAELVAECLACRAPEIVDLGCGFLAEADAWASARCLHEAMSVGQDPDCRGNVLRVMEARFEARDYGAAHARGVLSFDTESVPLQQFQARAAQHLLANAAAAGAAPLPKAEAEGVLNLALRVRDDLAGTEPSGHSGAPLWALALAALKRCGRALDAQSMDRLFWRENRAVLSMLAGTHGELLQWHLIKHPSRSLALCIAALADDGGYDEGGPEGMYSDEEDEEDFLGSDEDDGLVPFPPNDELLRSGGRSARSVHVVPLTPAELRERVRGAAAGGPRPL